MLIRANPRVKSAALIVAAALTIFAVVANVISYHIDLDVYRKLPVTEIGAVLALVAVAAHGLVRQRVPDEPVAVLAQSSGWPD